MRVGFWMGYSDLQRYANMHSFLSGLVDTFSRRLWLERYRGLPAIGYILKSSEISHFRTGNLA